MDYAELGQDFSQLDVSGTSYEVAKAAMVKAGLPDHSKHLSVLSRSRLDSPLKKLYRYLRPGMPRLAGGMPSPENFPISRLMADVPHSDSLTFDSSDSQKKKKSHKLDNITIPKYPEDLPINLATLLQYGQVTGLPALSKGNFLLVKV